MNRLAGLAVLVTVFCTSPAFAQKRIDEIVARVNSQIILKSEMDKELRQLETDLKEQGLSGSLLQTKIEEETKDLLRNMIDITLFMQMAKEQGIDVEPAVTKRLYDIMSRNKLPDLTALEEAMLKQGIVMQDVMEAWRRDLMAQEVMNREVASRIVISTEEMKTYYNEHGEEFKHEAGVLLGNIGVKKGSTPDEQKDQRKKIEEAREALLKGGDFGETASKYSELGDAQRGGVVGFKEESGYDELLPVIAEAVKKLEKNQVTEVLDVNEGYLVLKALDKHTGGVLPFDLAQNEIYGRMLPDRMKPKVREYLNKLREEGFVDVHEGYADTGAVKKVERPSKNAKKDNSKKKNEPKSAEKGKKS